MIYVLRHCKATGQEFDAALTTDGIKSAQQLVPVLAKLNIDHIYVSEMNRTYESIKPYLTNYKTPLTYDSRLNERILSDFHYRIHNGETSLEAQQRILEVFKSIPVNEHALIVTHGNIMSLLLNHFDKQFGFDEWKALKNPDLYAIDEALQVKHITI
ncbi:histidine phosphatase family protein [Mammaliicoccus sciuri]|uniref:histidine phosphatase family protein n=1 Tax=Mammaliicoccus sciuri TaxID=1296 RepID=UPI000CD0B63A|nr:histidine phosphatase family protein [Mammaliicoccus sciuri]MDT0669854.1 histidine phosphatase family protein [Mammaliicoccus sciuri]MEB5759153.1 histidine phosphatase family protein [Mammaliicoccus sciuri]PNZ28105.1 histidine phosphatase family protein [Mammaliicoccus sciuri]QQC96314.1 histidine phosphatase family protein [Mammaliicoccus sciuri]